jgi:hypothetical protein
MAKFKQLTISGTTTKVVVNMDMVVFMRPFDSFTDVRFSDQHSIEVAESVNDILQAETLTNA